MVERIIPKTPALAERERKAIEDLRELFPDGNVAGLDGKDKALGKRLSSLYRSLGYETRADMIAALGFRQDPENRGGRPVTTDPEALFAELQRRYEGRSKPTTVRILMHDNPDLSGTIKTVQNKCNEHYGHTITVELIERGLLDRKMPARVSRLDDDAILDALSALEKKYASAASRPATIIKLKEQEPDYADVLTALDTRRSRKLFGTTAAAYLKTRGIIENGGRSVDAAEIESVIASLQAHYLDKPNNDKPKSIAALLKAHPEHADALKAGQKAQLVTKDILTERGILGLSQAALKAREKLLKERCIRNAKVSELVRMYAGSGGAEVVMPDEQVDYLRSGVVGVDLKYRYELREVTMTVLGANLSVGDTLKAFHTISTGWYDRGKVELFKDETLVTHVERSRDDDFLVSKSYDDPTPLKQFEGAEVVRVETLAGKQFARIRYRFLSPISRETLLYALYRMDALSDAELYANDDSWRARLEQLPEDPIFAKSDCLVSASIEPAADALKAADADAKPFDEMPMNDAAASVPTDEENLQENGLSDEVPEQDKLAEQETNKEDSSQLGQELTAWTFERHQRAMGRRFSVEVPDQWVLTPDEGGRPLARYEKDVDDENEYPQIICSAMAGDLDEEMQTTLRENIIPETRIQLSRKAIYGNDMANTLSRVVNDWVVEGKNCQVQVYEILMPSIFPGFTSDSYEYHVKPIAYDHEDFLRLTDSWNHLQEGQLKELAFAIAPTVELDKVTVLRRLVDIDRYCEEPADADAFCELVSGISNMLNLSGSERTNANLWREIRRSNNDKNGLLVAGTMPRIQAEAYNASLDDEVAYYGRLVSALEKQRELDVDGFEKMWKLVGEFGDVRVVDHVTMEDNEESAKAINALDIISIPVAYQALHERWEALDPATGVKAKTAGQAADETTRLQEEAARKAAAETRHKAEEEARRKREEAARRKAAEEAETKRKAEEAVRRRAEREARQKAEEETRLKAEKELRKAREEAERKAKKELSDARRELPWSEDRLKDLKCQWKRADRLARKLSERIESTRANAPETLLKGVEESLKSYQEELSSLGFFAFGKKRELKDKIAKTEASKAELLEKIPSHYEQSIKDMEERIDAALSESADLEDKISACEEQIAELGAIVAKPLLERLSRLSKDETVDFGRYPQSSADADDEPIKWMVLEKKADRVLLLSTLVLDRMPFNKDKFKGTDYESSDLKRWLTGEFEQVAFGSAEAMLLVDSPFIMSSKEFASYLTTNASRICRTTQYALSKDKYRSDPAFYWLSDVSTDGLGHKVYYIKPHGMILGSGDHVYYEGKSFGAIGLDVYYDCGVRPAIWVKTKA